VPLHIGHSSIRQVVGWARRSGEWAFPSALVAGLGLQAFALSRWCAAGSPVTRAPGRMLSLTGQSVSPLLRPVVLAPARGFFQSCAPRKPQPLCSGRFRPPAARGAGGVGKRVFLRPGMLARGLCLRRCAGLESSNCVPLGTRVVPGAGADLGDQPCCRRYGVRCVLSQRRFFPARCARCRRDVHSG
jgi:hypothetical protein